MTKTSSNNGKHPYLVDVKFNQYWNKIVIHSVEGKKATMGYTETYSDKSRDLLNNQLEERIRKNKSLTQIT